MLITLVLLAAVITPSIQPAQRQVTETARRVKAGEVVRLGESLTVKVTRSTKSQFTDVRVKGVAVVVVLELDAGTTGAMLSYNASANARASDLYLATGVRRHAPRAVREDFPSWGSDNTKEVEVLDPKEPSNNVSLTFEGRGSIALLFDVPPAQATLPKRLSVSFRTIRPKEEQFSFVVAI